MSSKVETAVEPVTETEAMGMKPDAGYAAVAFMEERLVGQRMTAQDMFKASHCWHRDLTRSVLLCCFVMR